MSTTILPATDSFQFVSPPLFTLRFSSSSSSLASTISSNISDSESDEVPYTKSPLDNCRGCTTLVRKTAHTVRGVKYGTAHKKSRATAAATAKATARTKVTQTH
jgi:hypothetical protein